QITHVVSVELARGEKSIRGSPRDSARVQLQPRHLVPNTSSSAGVNRRILGSAPRSTALRLSTRCVGSVSSGVKGKGVLSNPSKLLGGRLRPMAGVYRFAT